MNVKEAFELDLNKYGTKVTQPLSFIDNNSNAKVEIEACVYYDFEANAKFLALFIPICPNPIDLIFFVLKEPIPEKIVPMSQLVVIGEVTDNNAVKNNWASEAVFSKRIFVYGEFELSKEELDRIESFSNEKNVSIKFRGSAYSESREKAIIPLAFISHDSQDKKLIARPLAEELRRRGCPVWYDEYSLKVGDSLRESIEKGIKECKKCILILSKHFLNNKGWTKAEFNAIFTKEIHEGKNVILPIWDKITHKEVYEYSPILADRFGLSWAKGRGEVAARIYERITKD
jgi:hypothetical protein